MSFRRFDLEKDVFMGEGFVEEQNWLNHTIIAYNGYNQGFYTANEVPNREKFQNHYVTGGLSGSFYLDVFDNDKSDFSSRKLISLTYGYTSSSAYFSGVGFVSSYQEPKLRMYKMMAKKLLGNESSIFSIDGRIFDELVFFCISRNLYKDFVKPQTFNVYFAGESDVNGSPQYSGHILEELSNVKQGATGPYCGLQLGMTGTVGLLFYNAGIFAVSPDYMALSNSSPWNWSGSYPYNVLAKGVSGTTYNNLLDGCRSRLTSLSFVSMTKVASSYFICKAGKSEFNYSSNPSFLNTEGQNVTNISSSLSTTYITTIALLGENHEVLAVAKLKEPLRKDSRTNYEITVRLST